MSLKLDVLILEDSENDTRLLVRKLSKEGNYQTSHDRVDSLNTLKAALDRQEWDIIISDHSMPQFSAIQALQELKDRRLDIPVIILSGSIEPRAAVAAMKAGASDYIMKDDMTRLLPAIERELREAKSRREKRSTENQLRQSQKMESIGRLAGGVAHDFNNLLTVILGVSELNVHGLPEGSVLKKDFEEIAATAMRAAALTKQLLTFSRKQVVEPKVISLNDVLKNVEKLMMRVIGEDVELLFKPSTGLGAVRIDPGQMEQLLVNLAVNARAAMPRGGRLTVETANAALDAEFASRHPGACAGEFVSLTVSDNGIGMTAEVQTRIFEPFFTTKGQLGTGLGLATCYGIVKQNGGYIGVDSAVGKGAIFTVYLPRTSDAPEPVGAKRGGETRAEGTETVLLVEDDERVRRLASRILRDRRYTILEADGVDEALRLVSEDKDGRIRMVITDVVMPKSDGRECYDKIKTLRPDMRFLFTSGYSDEAISHHGILNSGLKFIAKPFSTDGLARKVREILDSP